MFVVPKSENFSCPCLIVFMIKNFFKNQDIKKQQQANIISKEKKKLYAKDILYTTVFQPQPWIYLH